VDICRLFATLIRDESAPLDLRAVAYLRLFEVQGLKITTDTLRRLVPPYPGQFEKAVDWRMVDSFLREPGSEKL
jgi:hypothetical protein